MTEIQGYQPRPQAAMLVRVRGVGPKSHALRRLVERWGKARQKDRDLIDVLGRRHRELQQALAERDEALADADEAEIDGQPVDEKKARRLDGKVDEAERAQEAQLRRIVAFRPRLEAAEVAATHYAERNAQELGAELLPSLADAESRFREQLAKVQAAWQRLDDAVLSIDAVQRTVQGAMPVQSGGGDAAQLLALVGRVQGQPLMRLPDTLAVLAEEAGMVTTLDEGGRMIPANLPAAGGPRDVNALHAEQVRRMDQLAAQEGA